MLKRKYRLFFVLLPILTSCLVVHTPSPWDAPPQETDRSGEDVRSGFPYELSLLEAVLWVQTSVEYQLLSKSVYARAITALDEALSDPRWTAALEQREKSELPQKNAVILDIDETVLDNSPYQAQLILDGRSYDDASWKDWVLSARAGTVPGALDFVKAAESRGVKVFYVTSRDAERNGDGDSPMERATRKNMELNGFSLPRDEDTLLLKNEERGWGSDKSSRRAYVSRSYRVLLLVGDDLGDFLPDVRATILERLAKASAQASLWGRAWFMLPNPIYGSWYGALTGYDNTLSEEEVLRHKLSRLRGMK